MTTNGDTHRNMAAAGARVANQAAIESCEAVAYAGSTTTGSLGIEAFIAGFVAGEGCFTGSGSPRTSFTFSVGLGSVDREMCEAMREFFGCGFIVDRPRRKLHYDDESTYVVHALPELIEVIVPFMDEHLPPSYKRRQFEVWRDELLDYWESRAKRVRPCTVDSCDKPRRAKGLCRHHYYVRFGQ